MKLLKKLGLFVLTGAMALGIGLSLGSKDLGQVNAASNTVVVTRGSFPSGSLAYANESSFSATGSDSSTITGKGYLSTSSTAIQFRQTAPGGVWFTSLPGSITGIAMAQDGGRTARGIIPYFSATEIVTPANYGTVGTAGETKSVASDVDTTWTVQSSSNYKYVYFRVATNHTVYMAHITVTYLTGSVPATGVSIPETLNVTRGTPETITPTFSPAGSYADLTWTSSNESVATVSSAGIVTGLTAGTTTVRAAISELVYDECVVTVSLPATTSISVNPTALYMGIGALKTKTLVVSSLPVGSDNGATFDSDDYDVATVSSAGVVTGNSVGTATITVTSSANPSLVVNVDVIVYANIYDLGHAGTATSDSGATLTTADITSNTAGRLTGDASLMTFTTVSTIYPAAGKLKAGSSSANGLLAFNLPSSNNATKLIISASLYGSDESTIAVNNGTPQTVSAGADFGYYVFDISASNSVEIAFVGRVYFNALWVIYSQPTFGTLDSIAINNPASDLLFEVGETFSSAGLTLTATDTLSRTMAVNGGFTTNYDDHVFVPGDVGGSVAVTVSYTHGEVTKTTSYNITVIVAAIYYHDFVPTGAVEFSYVSSSASVTSTSEYKVMSGLAWNMVYTPQEGKNVSINNNNGITFGSGDHPFDTVAIKSGLVSIDGANKVTKVIVDISGNGGAAAGTVTVDVGGVALDYTDNAYAGAPAGREEMVFTSSTGLFGHVNVVLHGTTAGAGLYGIKVFADTDTTDAGLATNFASAVEGTDSCGVSAESDVSALRTQYNALSSTAKEALSSINIYDFAAGDVDHDGIQSVTFTAAQKWALLDARYPEVPGSGLVGNHVSTQSIYMIVIIAISGMTVLGGMFFLKRKREE